MTFQRRTAGRIIDLIRSLRPGVKVVVGGYDPSLAPEAYEDMGVDYLVRSEGEVTFRELLRAIGGGLRFRDDLRTFLPEWRGLGAQSCAAAAPAGRQRNPPAESRCARAERIYTCWAAR